MPKQQFNLIAFQERLIERFELIQANGVGLHRKRSVGRAWYSATQELIRRGYSESQAKAATHQARDMFLLRQLCDESAAD
jgi:hypothetical protein